MGLRSHSSGNQTNSQGGTNTGTGRKIPKKVSVLAYPAFACAVKSQIRPSFKGIRGVLGYLLEVIGEKGKRHWIIGN